MPRRAIELGLGPPGEWPTDARVVDRHEAVPERVDPDAGRRRRRRRRAALLVLGLVFLVGLTLAAFGEGGFVEFWRLRSERDALGADLAAAGARVETLRADVAALHDDAAARERIARERLGYARPGEMVFVLPAPAETATP